MLSRAGFLRLTLVAPLAALFGRSQRKTYIVTQSVRRVEGGHMVKFRRWCSGDEFSSDAERFYPDRRA